MTARSRSVLAPEISAQQLHRQIKSVRAISCPPVPSDEEFRLPKCALSMRRSKRGGPAVAVRPGDLDAPLAQGPVGRDSAVKLHLAKCAVQARYRASAISHVNSFNEKLD